VTRRVLPGAVVFRAVVALVMMVGGSSCGHRSAVVPSGRALSLRSDGTPVAVPRGEYVLGFAFEVDPLNLEFYGSDENCNVGPYNHLTPTESLRNVRLSNNSYVSVFANLKVATGVHLSCKDKAGRNLPLKLVALH
jgi:hypothetical protein